MRHWLLTTTTYGTWLPGDRRGFVSIVTQPDGSEAIHNTRGTPYDASADSLERQSREKLKGQPIKFTLQQAEALLAQFHETANLRRWSLLAVGIMKTHVHLVAGAFDHDGVKMLQDFKGYGSRALNARWPKPESGTWWTVSGSRRLLREDKAVSDAVRYVREQEFPLVIWADPRFIA